MPKTNATTNIAHSDNSGQFSMLGVAGTLGTADTVGSAVTVPIGVNPVTGAMYTESTLGASGTNVNIVTGTLQNSGSVVMTLGTVVGNVASGATDSGNPVKMGGIYGTTAPTLTDLQRGNLQLDVNANLKSTQATLLAGEDLTNNRSMVSPRYNYTHLTAALGTTIIKGTAAGLLHTVVINSAASATNVTTVFDSVAGTTAAVIAIPSAVTATVPITLTYDVAFTNGLVVEAKTAAGGDLTICWL